MAAVVEADFRADPPATSLGGFEQRTLPASQRWNHVTFGNGLFVAIGFAAIAATSPDGINWTQRTLPSSQDWSAVTFGNGLFVAVTFTSGLGATSPDGINWTYRAIPNSRFRSITFGNGLFVAASDDAPSLFNAATSPDGINWTQRTLPGEAYLYGVTFGNGLFVAVGFNVAFTSPDGITWTQRTLPSITTWVGVAFGNGLFVAVNNGSTIAATSPDGINWTQRTLPPNVNDITFGNGLFVAIGFAAIAAIAATSPDGINWTQRTLPSSQDWSAVTFGNGLFVAVARDTNIAATASFNRGANFSAAATAVRTFAAPVQGITTVTARSALVNPSVAQAVSQSAVSFAGVYSLAGRFAMPGSSISMFLPLLGVVPVDFFINSSASTALCGASIRQAGASGASFSSLDWRTVIVAPSVCGASAASALDWRSLVLSAGRFSAIGISSVQVTTGATAWSCMNGEGKTQSVMSGASIKQSSASGAAFASLDWRTVLVSYRVLWRDDSGMLVPAENRLLVRQAENRAMESS